MFQDRHCRSPEIENEIGSCFNVQDIGVTEFLPLQFAEVVAKRTVEPGLLVWIVAITQLPLQGQHGRETRRSAVVALAEIVRDRSVIVRRALEDLERQFLPQPQAGVPLVTPHLLQHTFVILRVGHHRHGSGILGRAPQHGGPPDINILDGFLHGHLLLRNGLLEWVEIDYCQVDRLDPVLLRLTQVLLGITLVQESAVHLGMQGLDPSLEQLRRLRIIGYIDHRQIRIAQGLRGPSGREQLHLELLMQSSRKIDQTRLARDREERALDCHLPGP